MRQTHVGVSRATAGPYFRHHGPVRKASVLAVLALVCAACSSGGANHALVRQQGTTTTSSSSSTTTVTTVPAPAVTVAPRPGCPPVPARLGPAPDRPQYALTVHVDLPQNTVDGDLKVRSTPDM